MAGVVKRLVAGYELYWEETKTERSVGCDAIGFQGRISRNEMKDKDEIESLSQAKGIWLFCELFPEDYEFDKETLIQLWSARDTIKGEHKNGDIWDLNFHMLLQKGYILCTGKCFPKGNEKYRMDANRPKDVVSSTLHRKLYARLNNLYYHLEAYKEVQHLSLVGDDIDEKALETLMKDFKYLKSLLLLSKDASSIKKVPHDMFLALKYLEILDLSCTLITELPSSLGYLVDLRYLDLSRTLIQLLPETIDCLSKLQTLKLNDCRRLFRLPEGIRKLISLVHLEFDVLGQLTIMPRGMGSLTSIETLSGFIVDKDEGRSIKELKNVNNLKGSFCISRLENVLSPSEANDASLSTKKYVKELELRWSDNGGKHDVEILERLRPHFKLNQLQISCYGGVEFPTWISDPYSLEMIKDVTLFKCENSKLLPSLGRLPFLTLLSLIEFNSVKEIGDEFLGIQSENHIAFPKLERLQIVGFSQLETWKEGRYEDYPSLCKLIIERCPKLIAFPTSFVQLFSLRHLEIICCTTMKLLPRRQNLSTSLKTLVIGDCPLIKKWLKKQKAKDWRSIENKWIDQEEI